jgi:acyl-CoA synthetase (NDP forming)
VAPALVHKSDAGGVVLGLATAAAVAAAATAMTARIALPLHGIWVERMAPAGGVDLVVGARRDPAFGPVVLIGAGGIFVEVLDDVAIALAPVAPAHVEGLLTTLRAAPLLAGARGGPAVDTGAVAAVAATLGDVLASHPDLAELEINPLRATAAGALALDARMVF